MSNYPVWLSHGRNEDAEMLNVDDLLWLEYKRIDEMRMDRYDMGDGTSKWFCWECGEIIEDDDKLMVRLNEDRLLRIENVE